MATAPPANVAEAVLGAERQILVAGNENTRGANLQISRYTLTAVDTATRRVRWHYAYNRPGFANDNPIGLTRSPRGGYVVTGDGQVMTGGFQHLLLETDSMGRQLKQQLIYPLGSNFGGGGTNGIRGTSDVVTNIVTLPNAQGYLTTGIADSLSTRGTIHNERAYLMRLDTALHVTWVYRNPPDVYGTGNRNQRANKVRLLGNGTAVYLVQDVRGTGVADLQLVQVELATGRAVNRAVLSSNTQAAVLAFDWDFVGDGTLVVCGKSTQVGVAAQQGWLARFDLRGTALLASRPAAAGLGAAVQVWPVPAHEAVNVAWPAGWETTRVEVRDGLGRLVHSQGVGVGQRTAAVGLAGLVPGVYVLRVLGQQGAVSKRLVVE